MTAERDFWEEIFRRFDPEQPAPDPAWRVERPYSPAESILHDLRRPFGDHRYLVYGTSGSGKTTELHWLARQRAQETLVVVVDLHRHFVERVGDPAALNHIQAWEVVLLVGLAVYAAGENTFGHRWSPKDRALLEEAAQRFARGAEGAEAPRLNIARFSAAISALAAAPAAALAAPVVGPAAAAAVSGVLGAVSTTADALSWEVLLGRAGRRMVVHDLEERAQQLLRAVNHLIAQLQESYRPLNIVIDGLDRVTNLETVQNLFVESTLIGSLQCAVVLSAPLLLRHQGLISQVRAFETCSLVNLPVLEQADPRRLGPGISFGCEIWSRRTADLGRARIPTPLLQRLVYHSGGHLREIIRLVRMLAEQGWDRGLPEVDAQTVERVLDERRRRIEEGLHRGHLELLRAVMDDPRHLLPEDDLVIELINNWWLLPYPNESTWWFPHPLLTRSLLPFRS